MSLSAERSASSARNLGNLFGSSRSASNDGTTRSLAYTAPKEPAKEVARTKEKVSVGIEKEAEASKASGVQYAYVGRTRLYKLESGAYVALSPEQLGCVILGAGSTYQLLIYDGSKRHLLTALIAEVVPAMPQENGYVTFSARSATWSAHFDNGAYDFCRALALTHAHCVAHKGDPSASPLSFYVLAPEGSGGRKAKAGDKVSVSRRKWSLDDSPTAVPTAVVTKAEAETDMAVVIIAGDSALGNALLGATVGEKRGFVEFAEGHRSWIETEVVNVTDIPREEPSLGDEPVAVVENSSSDDRRSSITERMAGLAAASGVIGVAPLIAPVRRESKATAAIEASKQVEPVKTEPPSDAADRLQVSERINAPEQRSNPVRTEAAALTGSNPTRSAAFPARTENAVALVPGQEARSHFFVGSARHEQESHEKDTAQTMLAMQSSMAMQQMQSALLAVQSSMSQAHHKLDRLMDSWTRNGAADGDLDALAGRVSAVLREHAILRATAHDRDSKRTELEDKLEMLREKNAQLVADKLAVLEKHAQLVSKGADETLRARTLEDAAKQRDELDGKLRESQAEKAALEQQLAAERSEVADLRARLDNAAIKAASSRDEIEAAVTARTAELGKEADRERAQLECELEKVRNQANFLEERCQDAEKKAHRLSQELEATTKQRDDALESEREALARAEHVAKERRESPPGQNVEDSQQRTELIKTIMNDTYKHLYAYFTASGPEGTFTAADAARAIKATLKQVTTKYLTNDQPGPT